MTEVLSQPSTLEHTTLDEEREIFLLKNERAMATVVLESLQWQRPYTESAFPADQSANID